MRLHFENQTRINGSVLAAQLLMDAIQVGIVLRIFFVFLRVVFGNERVFQNFSNGYSLIWDFFQNFQNQILDFATAAGTKPYFPLLNIIVYFDDSLSLERTFPMNQFIK